jgi:hypothetical protein
MPSLPPNPFSGPSLASDIDFPGKPALSPDEEERKEIARLRADAVAHHTQLLRNNSGATEPSSAYRNVLLTEKQINYLLVILKPYVSPIAEECRVKLESV